MKRKATPRKTEARFTSVILRKVTKADRAIIDRIKKDHGIATDSAALVYALQHHHAQAAKVESLRNDRRSLRFVVSTFNRILVDARTMERELKSLHASLPELLGKTDGFND